MSVGFEMRSPRRKCYYRGDYTKMKEMLRETRRGEEITGSTISEKFNQLILLYFWIIFLDNSLLFLCSVSINFFVLILLCCG